MSSSTSYLNSSLHPVNLALSILDAVNREAGTNNSPMSTGGSGGSTGDGGRDVMGKDKGDTCMDGGSSGAEVAVS